MIRHCCPVALLSLCVACATADDDNRVADATVGGVVDATAGSPDATVGTPDAMVGSPDAMVGAPDAMVGAPDAMVGSPDAMVGSPDAAAPDAMTSPDAMLVIDAGVPDAMPPIDATPPADAPIGNDCVLQSPSFSQNTPVAITDLTTVTSTLVVSGADPYMWDVKLTTGITHTFNGDLDIVLISPAGTRVTLSRGLGGTAANIFNGSLWDDSAVTPVVNYSFVDGSAATPIAPEAAFGMLAGQNPNGTWTIEVTDSASVDEGSINSWSLQFTTSVTPTPANGVHSSTGPVAIPDSASTTSNITVSGAGTTICDINLTTSITHTYSGDLDLWLVSPSGTRTVLVTDNDASGAADVFDGSLWDDETGILIADYSFTSGVAATPLLAEGAMGAFSTENPNGVWTLEVADTVAMDTGSIDAWSLSITTCDCP